MNALNSPWVLGIDEAGRGCWVGSVFAGAVLLNPENSITGLADSKKLSPARREALAGEIQTKAIAWGVGFATAAEVDAVNILQATFLAMQRAEAAALARLPQGVEISAAWVDGNRKPKLQTPNVMTIIKGDATVAAISAASILAKVARDAHAAQLHAQFPNYGFAQHKGYGTALHRAKLLAHGVCPEHRLSFEPMRSLRSMQTMHSQ